jgi:hypothetical protein
MKDNQRRIEKRVKRLFGENASIVKIPMERVYKLHLPLLWGFHWQSLQESHRYPSVSSSPVIEGEKSLRLFLIRAERLCFAERLDTGRVSLAGGMPYEFEASLEDLGIDTTEATSLGFTINTSGKLQLPHFL